MHYAIFRTHLAVLFGLVLTATGLWASPAGEEESGAAMEKEMVTDPTIGKAVTAPEYGGTLTRPASHSLNMLTPFMAPACIFFSLV